MNTALITLTCCHSQMQIYCYEENKFESIDDALRGNGRITALAVLFEVSQCFSVQQDLFFFFLWYSIMYMVSQESVDDNENYAALIDGVNAVSRYGMWVYWGFFFFFACFILCFLVQFG